MENLPLVLIGSKYVDICTSNINKSALSVDIIMYDWRFYPGDESHVMNPINAALIAAVKRGVQVRALVNSKMLRDNLVKVGIKARTLNSKKILHAKAILIDGKTAIVGSHNFTQGGMALNHEVSIVCDLQTTYNDLREYFQNLYGL